MSGTRSRSGPAESVGGAAVRAVGVVHVYRVFGTDVAALRGVDLDVGPGERVALLGPSGSGKSTLLSVLAGLRRPSAGSVLVDGDDIARFSERRMYRYRSATGLMLQGAASNLLSYATPAENVRFAGSRAGSVAGAGERVLVAAGLDADRRTVDRLDRAGQQAVALAVAVVNEPRLLLVDEPTSQLDDTERDLLLDALVDTSERAGTTVVMVTHDEAVAARMQRMIRMRDGRIGAEGLRHEQYAVIGSDGSVQLPEELLANWPAGSTVRVQAASADEIRLVRRSGEDREPDRTRWGRATRSRAVDQPRHPDGVSGTRPGRTGRDLGRSGRRNGRRRLGRARGTVRQAPSRRRRRAVGRPPAGR